MSNERMPHCRDCGLPMTWSCVCARTGPRTHIASLGGGTAIGGEPLQRAVSDPLPYDEGPPPPEEQGTDLTLRQRISDAIWEAVGEGVFTDDELRFYTDISMKAVADHACAWCGGRDRDKGERVVPLAQLIERTTPEQAQAVSGAAATDPCAHRAPVGPVPASPAEESA